MIKCLQKNFVCNELIYHRTVKKALLNNPNSSFLLWNFMSTNPYFSKCALANKWTYIVILQEFTPSLVAQTETDFLDLLLDERVRIIRVKSFIFFALANLRRGLIIDFFVCTTEIHLRPQ